MQESSPNAVPMIVLNVGNTNYSFAVSRGSDIDSQGCIPIDQPEALLDALSLAIPNATQPVPVVMSSVNPQAASALSKKLLANDDVQLFTVGVDVQIPLTHSLPDAHTTGQDRFLAALAAYKTLEQACVVVDSGTAITVDFVDGEGTYHGGCILPGAHMMLDSLHEHTAELPKVVFRTPQDETYPSTTEQAMLAGVYHTIRGGVRQITERYALDFGAFPTVVATGGDAATLFEDDDLVERIVPDLLLRGIAHCATDALAHTQ